MISPLLEIHQRLITEKIAYYKRKCYADFKMNHRMMGIVGPRGVGKTTFLLHYIKQNHAHSSKALYVSADHLFFSKNTLLDMVKEFHEEYAGELICIDEVHRYPNWNQELKNIYDSYPKMKILFSGSSSIDLVKGKYDLSRRAILIPMAGLSFREFLEIKLEKPNSLPIFTLQDLLNHRAKQVVSILSIPRLKGYFKEYLQGGYYPFFNQIPYPEYSQMLLNMMEKVIYEDVGSFYSLRTGNLSVLKKIMYFVSTSSPGGFSIHKLAKSLEKDHTTTSDYLEMLRETKLLRYLLKKGHSHTLVKNAEKIYVHDFNLLHAINQGLGESVDIGLLRELFVISQLQDAGYEVRYSQEGDIACQGNVFEIGGVNKNRKQLSRSPSRYLIKDDLLTAEKNSIPLYLFGFLK